MNLSRHFIRRPIGSTMLALAILLAVCIQHEIDHLNGKLFIQHLSRLKQNRIRQKVLKMERERSAA